MAAVIVGGVGLVLGLAGAAVAHFVPRLAVAEHARLAALPSPGAHAIGATPVGTEVLVEGRILASQPRRFRDFVAYVKEEEERDTTQRQRGIRWKVVESVTPSLDLVTADGGTLRIVDDSYAIISPSTRWQDRSKIIDTSYGGLVSDEPVFVHGRVAAGGIDAIAVGSGTRAAYLETVAGQAGVAWWLGVGFQTVGGVLVLVAIGLRLSR
ncbi:hypothetical protein TBR22_A08970 [Luteitalea sp. TBR-22]|nr:hypothetical protein TBR22_A08970 [Luteitalea sp. TBR-22]